MDKDAQARYMVYSGNSWISFDDVKTFQSKIDYANKMGLSGLMVWAVDLDDGQLSALSAISDTELIGGDSIPFTLVDLEHLFPKNLRPPKDVEPKYGLVTFGAGGGQTDPTSSPFGLTVAGESHVVTKLKKRDGEAEPFTFLDCPHDIDSQTHNETLTARVVCLNEDVEGCFRLLERGVEGTIVEMPDDVSALPTPGRPIL